MSNEHDAWKVEEHSRTLSLAVKLVDAFTGDRPIGDPKVRIEGHEIGPVINPSGYRLFLDLPAGTVTLEVDAGEHYQGTQKEAVQVIDLTDTGTDVDPSDSDTLPLVEIELVPSTAYRFPRGATRIRGHVLDSNDDGVSGAQVTIQGIDRSIETTDSGEFVLFFADTTEYDVTMGDDRTLVTVNGGNPTIEVTHSDLGNTSSTLAVEEGTLTVHEIPYQ